QHCEVALEVYANDGVPVGFAGVGQVAATDEASVVDQNVEAAEGVHRGLDEAACTVPVRDVVVIDDRFAASRGDLVDHLVGRARSDVVYHHVGTFGGESQRVRAPDAAAGTCHYDHPAVDESHCVVSLAVTCSTRSEGVNLVGRLGQVMGAAGEQCRRCCDGVQGFANQLDLTVLGNEATHEQMVGQSTRRGGGGVNDVFREDLVRGLDEDGDVLVLELEVGVVLEHGGAEALDALGSFEAVGQAQRHEERHLEGSVLGEQGRCLLRVTDVAEEFLQKGCCVRHLSSIY